MNNLLKKPIIDTAKRNNVVRNRHPGIDKYIATDTGYTKLNNHEEAFISYGMDFNASNDSDFKLTGAFGGAKQ